MKPTRADVLALFHDPQRTYGAHDLAARLGLDFGGRRELREILRGLVTDGRLERRGGRFALAGADRGSPDEVIGVVSFRSSGSAELTTDEGQEYTILARHLCGALPGDRVRAALLPAREGLRRAAEVRELVRSGPGQVLGLFRKAGRGGFLEPREPELFPFYLAISRDETGTARDGDLVVAELHAPPPEGATRVSGRVLEVLGSPSDPSVEVAAIAYHHGLALEFPEDVLREVEDVPQMVRAEDRGGRVDLRDVPFVTIDGADARDFDDAVAVRRIDDDTFIARVAVADVSHYVREGMALDDEAQNRGTSVYFPGRVLPMLPHPLSNGICSLKPDVDRLAMVVTLELDGEGRVRAESFHEAVIRSHARLTYDEVWDCIRAKQPLRGAGDPAPLVAVCEKLGARRRERGSIDFDIPEAKVIVDADSEIVEIARRPRNLAHRIVEELMLAANEAVARFFGEREAPTVYRIHDVPDAERIGAFARLAAALGFRLRPGESDDPRALARFVETLGDRPGARALHSMLLRSMKQAQYGVENIGHFGLAATEYLHFTSPIRRYPDLLVHRLLRAHLRGRGVSKPKTERRAPRHERARDEARHPYHALRESLTTMAQRSSSRERESMDAEREVVAYYRARLMSRYVGEEFDGRVAGVAPFGLFVEIEEPFVDGLLHVQSLGDDFYEYFEETQRLSGRGTGRSFTLGDKLRVRVDAVNVDRRQVSFGLVAGAPGESARSSPPARGRRSQGPRRRRS